MIQELTTIGMCLLVGVILTALVMFAIYELLGIVI